MDYSSFPVIFFQVKIALEKSKKLKYNINIHKISCVNGGFLQ